MKQLKALKCKAKRSNPHEETCTMYAHLTKLYSTAQHNKHVLIFKKFFEAICCT